MLTTLGLGDTVPAAPLLRLLSPLEALAGFALLSASVSWFMQLYPALARRRAFAIELTSLHSAGLTETLEDISPAEASAIVRSSSQALAMVTADLVQNAEIFYFTDGDERLSAARAIGFVTTLRDAALASPHADVRAEGRQLSGILDELATRLRQQYAHVRGESTDDILAAFARESRLRLGDRPRLTPAQRKAPQSEDCGAFGMLGSQRPRTVTSSTWSRRAARHGAPCHGSGHARCRTS